MRRLNWIVALALLAAASTFLPHGSHAQTRITYAEAFTPLITDSAGVQKPSPSRRLQLRAFGQDLVLQLEENSRLAAQLPSEATSRAPDLKLFRGSVQGRDGSWVRLTLSNGRYEGAIWDGSELYGVEPRGALPAEQYVGGAASSTSLIYRAADIANDAPLSCGVGNEPMNTNVLQQYKSFAKELSAVSALAATRDIEIAMVADFEFYSQNAYDAMTTMIARMNTVDGIFSSQLDVNIVPAEFTIFTTSADPFDTTDASTLLQQLSAFRESTPAVRGRGLAHLFSGREFDGTTVGIAYRDTLCHPQTGVSASQAGYSSVQHALIIAHELGHNFGAGHDGTTGDCSTTPRTFLMAPAINGSSTFSACSVQSMQASASAAACVAPARTRDIAVSVPTSPVSSVLGQSFDYVADVASIGEGTAYNIVTTTTFDSYLRVLSASMPDAECTSGYGTAVCKLTSLEPGQSRRMTVRLEPSLSGSFTSRASVVSSADRNPNNDGVDVPVQVNLSQAASIVFSPPSMSTVIRTPLQLVADITATGVDPLVDTTAIVRGGSLQISSVTADTGSCAYESYDWVCHLQTMTPQQRRRITIQASTWSVGSTGATIEIRAGAAPQRLVGSGTGLVEVTPQYDIALYPLDSRDQVVAIGATAQFPIEISSRGSQATPNARMTVSTYEPLDLELIAPGVTCTAVALGLECVIANLSPGTTINGTVRARSSTPVRTHLFFDIPQSVPDDYSSNNRFLLSLDVRVGSDVGTTAYSSPVRVRDGVRTNGLFTVYSHGATLASNVRATLTLPAGFVIHSASMKNGTCNVNALVVACQLPTMTATYANVDISFTAPEPGDFEGSFDVDADGDAVATNNSISLPFAVVPNVDARLVAPSGLSTLINQPIDVRLDVVTNRYAVPSAQLQIDLSTNLVVESIQTQAGTCQQMSYRIVCELGALAPNATTAVTVRIRPTSGPSVSLYPNLIVAGDMNTQDNYAQVRVGVDTPGDAVLSVCCVPTVATENQRFLIGTINVRAAGRATDTFIEFFFDRSRVTLPELSGNPLCDWTSSPARCPLGTIEQGAVRQLTFAITPSGSGALPIRIRVVATNETNPADNEWGITLDVQAPTASPPSNGGGVNKGGGGGGGGSMTLLLCFGLASMALARRRASMHVN